MPYPEELVRPMREELTRLGVEELKDADAVDTVMAEAAHGTTFAVVNSVCGCAAGNARPAVALVKNAPFQPDRYVTVFAGQDLEATARLREYLVGIPPSSPFFALLKDGKPVFIVERRHIEGRSASAIAADVAQAFSRYCGTEEVAAGAPDTPEVEEYHRESDLPPTFRSIL